MTRIPEERLEVMARVGPVYGVTREELAELVRVYRLWTETQTELAMRRANYRTCVTADRTSGECPIHGRCACFPHEDASIQAFEGSDTSNCPLHSLASLHAVPPIEDHEGNHLTPDAPSAGSGR